MKFFRSAKLKIIFFGLLSLMVTTLTVLAGIMLAEDSSAVDLSYGPSGSLGSIWFVFLLVFGLAILLWTMTIRMALRETKSKKDLSV